MTIKEFGFHRVGDCVLDKTLKSGVRFRIEFLADERAIYAFVVGDIVKYIGICESPSMTLKKRMSDYQGIAGNGTERRIVEEIRRCLAASNAVEIWAWQPQLAVQLSGLTADFVKGFENPLIDRLRPEWNIRGKVERSV